MVFGPNAVDLGAERVLLGVVQQRERVRRGAHRRDAPGAPGLEVRRGVEAGDVRRARGGDGRVLARAARAHLGDGSAECDRDHACGGARDRRVVVERREHEGLEHHRLGERRLDRDQRRAGEVRLALAVAPDVAAEAVVGEPVERLGPHDLVLAEPLELGVLEAESVDELEQAAGAGDDAVAAPVGQATRERLEEALAVGGAVTQRGIHHRELVSVGEQRS